MTKDLLPVGVMTERDIGSVFIVCRTCRTHVLDRLVPLGQVVATHPTAAKVGKLLAKHDRKALGFMTFTIPFQ